MLKSDFHYELPPKLIAQYPAQKRTDARLLVVDGFDCQDQHVRDLPQLLQAGDLLVLNNTQVIRARLFGHKDTGGQVEVMLERVVEADANLQLVAQIRASKAPKVGSDIHLANDITLTVTDRLDGGFYCLETGKDQLAALKDIGEVPLPPYIERTAETMDAERYQTVYASEPGAVAAPTAGLHFDDDLLTTIKSHGVDIGTVTLHVGAGTFQPVRAEHIEDHQMHSEFLTVNAELCRQVAAAKAQGGRVIAVGTTSARALEAAASDGALQPYVGETEIFIYPRYEFQIVDVLMTNFHLPESTLLMLVAAFIGLDETMSAYEHAVDRRYRFFSYGDAMWATRKVD